jgi:hypothetical protein
MDVGAQAAVGAGGDVLSADELSQCDDGIGISSGCSTKIGGVADDAREGGSSRRVVSHRVRLGKAR